MGIITPIGIDVYILRQKRRRTAEEKDPHNNNSYGTLQNGSYLEVELPILDVSDFNERIIRGYEDGTGEKELPADLSLARSFIPAGTATLRDFSYVAPEIPEYIVENCTGCMDCVTQCPDTAILGKVLAEPDLQIASIALYHELPLVTHNQRHFNRVPGLILQDWLT